VSLYALNATLETTYLFCFIDCCPFGQQFLNNSQVSISGGYVQWRCTTLRKKDFPLWDQVLKIVSSLCLTQKAMSIGGPA